MRLCWPAGRDIAVSTSYDGGRGDKREINLDQEVVSMLVSDVRNRSFGSVIKSERMNHRLSDADNIFPVEVKSPDSEFSMSVKDIEGRAFKSFIHN